MTVSALIKPAHPNRADANFALSTRANYAALLTLTLFRPCAFES